MDDPAAAWSEDEAIIAPGTGHLTGRGTALASKLFWHSLAGGDPHMKNFFLTAGLGLAVAAIASPSRADPLDYFRDQLKPYQSKPAFKAPGPPFDATHCMAGKSVFSVPDNMSIPFVSAIEKSKTEVAAKVGFKFTSWNNQGQTSQWIQGVNAAVTEKPTVLDLMAGTDPRVLVPQIGAARAAGIPVVVSHDSGLEQDAIIKKYADYAVPIDYFRAGALLLDWAALKTGGKLDALVLISTGPLSTDSMQAGIAEEMKHCTGCTIRTVNVPGVDWATRITPTVQSALLGNPKMNYIIAIYDSMLQFVIPAITITNSADRVKANGFNGTPFVLGLVQQGKVDMDLGENLDWVGHALMDADMRVACHLPPVTNPEIPLYVFDKSNANEAGNPPESSKGYGDAYIAGYKKLWMMP
jgi:ribose transport system substrate-binding protein